MCDYECKTAKVSKPTVKFKVIASFLVRMMLGYTFNNPTQYSSLKLYLN